MQENQYNFVYALCYIKIHISGNIVKQDNKEMWKYIVIIVKIDTNIK